MRRHARQTERAFNTTIESSLIALNDILIVFRHCGLIYCSKSIVSCFIVSVWNQNCLHLQPVTINRATLRTVLWRQVTVTCYRFDTSSSCWRPILRSTRTGQCNNVQSAVSYNYCHSEFTQFGNNNVDPFSPGV